MSSQKNLSTLDEKFGSLVGATPSSSGSSSSSLDCSSGWLYYLFVFLIFSIISYLILYSLNPEFLRQVDDKGNITEIPDPMKVGLAAIAIGLLSDLITYFFSK